MPSVVRAIRSLVYSLVAKYAECLVRVAAIAAKQSVH